MEPKVQGGQYAAYAGNAEVGFQVNVMVPHQAGDSVSTLEARHLENSGKGSCTPRHFPVGITVNRVVRAAGDNFDAWKKSCRPLQERSEREGKLHHCSLHGIPRLRELRLAAAKGRRILPRMGCGVGKNAEGQLRMLKLVTECSNRQTAQKSQSQLSARKEFRKL